MVESSSKPLIILSVLMSVKSSNWNNAVVACISITFTHKVFEEVRRLYREMELSLQDGGEFNLCRV